MSRGLFITLDGSEATGKTTQLSLLKQWLEQKNHPVYFTREPGGTPEGEAIRQLVLNQQSALSAESELLLVLAARVEHVRRVILPKLEAGITVISDRYHDSTYAYQGFGRGIALEKISELERWLDLPAPDLSLILMSDADIATARLQQRQQSALPDRIERESPEFHARVRAGYFARSQLPRHVLIDANQSVEQVFAHIQATIQTAIESAFAKESS